MTKPAKGVFVVKSRLKRHRFSCQAQREADRIESLHVVRRHLKPIVQCIREI